MSPIHGEAVNIHSGTEIRRPLVTGVGGAAGSAVLGALRSAGIHAVAGDCDPRAAALALAGDSCVLPSATDPDYLPLLVKIAAEHGADAVVCTVAEEMAALEADAVRLAEAGLACWVPSAQALDRCLDKARFATCLAGSGIATPATAHPAALPSGADPTAGVPGPWIVKPRFGRGSRDVYPAEDAADLAYALRRTPDPIVQTRLTGAEFTVDALVARDGGFCGGVARWRDEVKAGISTKGETFADARVTEGVAAVLAAVGLCGVACVQGFVTDADEVVFTEVNPRFSGGLPLSLAAGADLVGQYLRGVAGLPIRPERLAYRAGVRMSRYFQEVFTG